MKMIFISTHYFFITILYNRYKKISNCISIKIMHIINYILLSNMVDREPSESGTVHHNKNKNISKNKLI